MGKIGEYPLFVANWKQSGDSKQALQWIETVGSYASKAKDKAQIILCPPFALLPIATQAVKETNMPIAIGSQDIGHFPGEKHTGEVSPAMIAEFASYAIVGHSERRSDIGDTDRIVAQKVTLAKKHELTPLVCVSGISQATALKKYLETDIEIIVYEPVFAIGTGNPDSPENANRVAAEITELFPKITVLYGGSVDGTNSKKFVSQQYLSGVLVGHRSTNPAFFLEVIVNAR